MKGRGKKLFLLSVFCILFPYMGVLVKYFERKLTVEDCLISLTILVFFAVAVLYAYFKASSLVFEDY